ncbi:MAG: DUF1493 family protein [Brevundimonas sp.]|nr:DUF1493 family protein [Brevundimonas sp.]MBP8072324.1 DUF1493 family protein [Brevundimonas sp.]
MSETRTAVLEFLKDARGWTRPLPDDADLFDALGIDGDDGTDFMEAFVARFDVDATDFRWYFHHADEGWNFGALFYRPIYRRFGRIPITLAVLTEAVRTRRWPIVYPDHIVPGRRWDILINQIFVAAVLIGLAALGWVKFAG